MSSLPATSRPHGSVHSKRGLRLRAATLEDYAQIASLESRHDLPARGYEDWSRLWLDNPVFRELPEWNIGWVLEDAGGRIVGSIGNIPLAYQFEGRRILAATGRSWVTEPEYRGFTIQLPDRVINQPGIDLYLNSTVSVNSIASVDMLQCERVPAGLWDESAFWVTEYRGFFRSVLEQKGYGAWSACAVPLAAVFRVKDWLRASPRAHEAEIHSCEGFDERFDEFWRDLAARKRRVLLAVRSREMLEWHYKLALRDRRLWILLAMNGSRIAAYAIFERNDNVRSGLRRVRLVDFQSLTGDDPLEPLLRSALERCRAENIHALESTGRWLGRGELIARTAPYRRNLPVWTFFYRTSDSRLAEALRDPAAWNPSLFDGDASL